MTLHGLDAANPLHLKWSQGMLGIFLFRRRLQNIIFENETHTHPHANKHRPHIERVTWLMCKSQAKIYMDTQSVPTVLARVCESLFLYPCNKREDKNGECLTEMWAFLATD